MKSAATLFALFLLSALTLHLPSATAFVVDTDGKPIRNGASYYIMSAGRGAAGGGGVRVAATGNETCPVTVVQSPNWMDNGLPVRISSPARILYIHEGLILDLEFPHPPPCATTPARWTIVKGQPEGWAVKLPGYQNRVQGGFRIKSISGGFFYRLVFCPRADSGCRDVGIDFDSNRNRRLVVGKEATRPLLVVFKKASYSAAEKILSYSAAA